MNPRLWLHLFALATAIAVGAPAHATDDAHTLIERHIEWRGGARFVAMPAVAREGRVDQTGMTGHIAESVDQDGRHRTDIDLGALTSGRAVRSDGGWMRTASGQIETMQPDHAERARRGARIEFAAGLRDDAGTPHLLGTETLDDRAWAVVRYAYEGDEHYDLFLDADSGALHAMRTHDDGREQVVRYSDWRTVEGIRFPFGRETRSTMGASTATWTHIAVSPALDTALFAAPDVASRVSYAGNAAGSGWLDFEFFGGHRIFIPARVNGRDTLVLLDSGAETTVLDAAFAASVGLDGHGDVTALGTGGTQSARFLPGLDIELGTLRLDGVTGVAIDLSGTAAALGHPLPVVLGKEILNETVAEIDFERRRIAFHDPARFQAPADAQAVAVLPGASGIREVTLQVEDDAPIHVDFDLGNGGPLVLFPAYWQREGWLDGRTVARSFGGAVGGLREQATVRIGAVTLGPFRLQDVPTTLSPGGGTALEGTRTLGNLGLPVLTRFHLFVDYPHDRLLLRPNARFDDPFQHDRSGLALVRDGDGLRVVFVSPGSPAAAQWRADERIVAVDGRPVEALDSPTGWRERAPGTDVELTLDDGSTRRLRLRDYF